MLKKEKYDRKFIYEKILNEVQSKIKGDDYNENYLLQKECSDLYHQSKLIRHTKTVAQSLKMYKNAISAVFPVIISNPDVAASLYGGQKDLFDYVIFDEASQVTLERSVPILFLGKINIISGDQKQLQPSDFFQGKMKDEYEDTYVEGEDDQILDFSDIEDSSSLLAFTEKKFHKTMLTYHYRSQKRELIEFSNAVFYDRNLIVANTPKDNQLGIEVKTIVDGV
ncbi:MAG: hypothetical protein LBV69_02710 [Bacteroidales bacterium]|nr:hypothetical protein [Bacteroidales bacterium]